MPLLKLYLQNRLVSHFAVSMLLDLLGLHLFKVMSGSWGCNKLELVP